MNTEPNPTSEAETPRSDFSITLSIWEWHHLLAELEGNMCVINRDQRNVRILYSRIASQLSGQKIDVTEPAAESVPVSAESSESSKSLDAKPFWKRWISR